MGILYIIVGIGIIYFVWLVSVVSNMYDDILSLKVRVQTIENKLDIKVCK